MLDTGCWILDGRYWILAKKKWSQDRNPAPFLKSNIL